ncbi:hypothetical protein AAFH68_21040 [Flavobacterium sp. CGRL1]
MKLFLPQKKSRDYELISGLYKAVAIIFMNNNERGKASEYLSEAQKYIERAIKKIANCRRVENGNLYN